VAPVTLEAAYRARLSSVAKPPEGVRLQRAGRRLRSVVPMARIPAVHRVASTVRGTIVVREIGVLA